MIDYALSFIAVVKAGGFSAAAKNTGISKACLSRHVSQLEASLEIPLLHRTTRSVVLTEAGKKFYASCQSIEENYQEAINSLKHDFKSMEGTLRITAPIDFGIQFMPEIIESFLKQYPKMDVALSLSNINESVAEKNFDIAIRIAHQLPDSNLRMVPLFHFKRLICASPEYLKNKQRLSTIDMLKDHRCITSVNHNTETVKPQWQFIQDNKIVKLALTQCLEIDSLFAQLDLIKRGCGIGRLPDYLIQDSLKSGELIEVLAEVKKPDSHVYILYPNTLSIPEKTRAFIQLLKLKMS